MVLRKISWWLSTVMNRQKLNAKRNLPVGG